MRQPDVIVVGLGTVGAATCLNLARRGISVLGLDTFTPPHRKGSHHGRSRSVRRAYLEGTGYLPMALRAWEGWRQLENDSGERLLVTTGNLTLGLPDGPALSGFLASARSGNIAHEVLSAGEVRTRWPQLRPPDAYASGLETRAGIVFPEPCVRVFLRLAHTAGARLQVNERVTGWMPHGDGIRVQTIRGSYTAGRLLIAAGAGSGRLLGLTANLLAPKRVPVHWVDTPDTDAYGLGNLPVNFWQVPIKTSENSEIDYREFYVLPVTEAGGRIKAAFHNGLVDADPQNPAPAVSAEEQALIRSMLQRFLPELSERPMDSETCLYTLTPDDDFILGALPENENVFGAALAGHGFKFAPVLGHILADLTTGIAPPIDVDSFSPRRFFDPDA